MADPTDPTTTETTVTSPDADQLRAWETYNQFTAQAAQNIEEVNGISSRMQSTFSYLNDGLKKLNISFTELDAMRNDQIAGFGVLTTTVLGTKEAFTSLADVDTSRMSTFTGQIKEMQETLKQSPVYKMLAKQLDDVSKAAEGMSDKIAARGMVAAAKQKLDEFTKVVSDSGMAMLTSADNSMRLQNAMVQLTIAAGNSRDLFQGIPGLMDGVGDGFENIGVATKFYTQALEEGTRVLGGNQKLAAEYMAQINRMPGGLKALIEPLNVAGNETNIMAASIEYAVGAGRKQEEVFADMRKAMEEYSISGGDALRFSSRMTEIADSTGAQFKDVQSALHGVVDEFKMYVNSGADASKMTQGMADSMRNYVSELTSVGVPAQNAIEMFKNYSAQMKNMNIGQQAFLSTMSGGPGGLRGALQVQEDIAKGNFDKLRQQAEQTIKRISGPLITREEAMKSEAGSAQYVRQMQVLQQGPLGSMARTPGEADSLIRAMKEGKAFKPEKTPEEALGDTMNRGVEWQKGSYTELQKINANLQNIMLRGGNANLGTAQMMFTPAAARSIPGGSGTGRGISPDSQERLLASQRTITTPAPGSDVFKQVSESVMNLPKTFSDAWKSFNEAVRSGNKESIQKANDKMMDAIKQQQASFDSMSDTQKEALKNVNQAFSATKPNEQVANPKINFTPIENYARPGQRIPAPRSPSNNQPSATASAPASGSGGIGTAAPGQAVPVTLAPGSAITVNFTGVCPHCGADVNHSTTDATVSPQSGTRR